MSQTHTLIMHGWHKKPLHFEVPTGTNLRTFLLEQKLSPYTRITTSLNCGGRGICATCGVWILDQEIEARHWHDRAAKAWGYPRLSCQIIVDQNMNIAKVSDKWIWGGRRNQPLP